MAFERHERKHYKVGVDEFSFALFCFCRPGERECAETNRDERRKSGGRRLRKCIEGDGGGDTSGPLEVPVCTR